MKPELFLHLVLLLFSFASASAQTNSSTSRTWIDSTGKHKIVGTFVEVEGDLVVLRSSDGTKKRIPLKKLSAADQQFVQENCIQNPFNNFEDGTKPSKDISSPIQWVISTKQNWDDVPHIDFHEPIPWKVPLPSTPELKIDPNRVLLASKRIEMGGPTELMVDVAAKRLFVCNQGADGPIRRISIIDMNDGNLQNSDVVPATMSPVAVLPGSTSLVMIGSATSSDPTQSKKALEVWTVQGKKVRRSGVWLPFEKNTNVVNSNTKNELEFVDVLPSSEIVTLSQGGHLAVWDIRSQKPIWHSQLDMRCCVAVAPDKSLMAVLDGSKLMVVEPTTARLLGLQTLDLDSPSLSQERSYSLTWTGDGKQLMLLTSGVGTAGKRLLVFDAQSGEIVKTVFDMPHRLFRREFNRDGGAFNLAHRSESLNKNLFLQSPTSEYVLIDEELMFHIPSQLPICAYLGSEKILLAGGLAFVARCQFNEHRGTIMPMKLPHSKAIDALNDAQRNPEYLLFRPGSEVEISVDRIPPEQRAEVYKKIETRLASKKISVVKGAKTRIEADCAIRRSVRVSIAGSETQTFIEVECKIILLRGFVRIWQACATNYPRIQPSNFGVPLKQTIANQSGKPSLDFFDTVELPMFLIRDPSVPTNNREVLLKAEFKDSGGIK
jgi:hypothetical protein